MIARTIVDRRPVGKPTISLRRAEESLQVPCLRCRRCPVCLRRRRTDLSLRQRLVQLFARPPGLQRPGWLRENEHARRGLRGRRRRPSRAKDCEVRGTERRVMRHDYLQTGLPRLCDTSRRNCRYVFLPRDAMLARHMLSSFLSQVGAIQRWLKQDHKNNAVQ